jgi:hypothetical protein
VLLHKLLQAATERDPSMLGLLRGARRSFGWNVLGGPCSSHLGYMLMVISTLFHYNSSGMAVVRVLCI